MKKILLALAALSLALPALAADFPKGSPTFVHSYADAMSSAKASGKPVILVFSAVWCPPCQSMKKNVYPSSDVKAFHDKFVWAYLDVDEASNQKATKEFKVEGIPHIQFLSADGKTLGSQVGGTSPKEFAGTLAGVLKKAVK